MKEIRDEHGHSVQMKNLSEALYKDGEGEYLIGIEGLTENGVAIYANDVQYWDRSNKLPITKEKKAEIISSAARLFQSTGMRVELY